ncbi:hypothetical protein MJM83_34525, partial [Salmonella enterica subsp. enterica serovar Montevideo]|nr:hypothetical protein [Salmonella enterica subsp. enterica serovar Montevideo]
NETNVISNIINEVRNMGEGNGGYGTANYNQAIINSEAISSKVMRAAPVHSPLATARLWRYPVMDCSGEVVRTVNRPLAWR